MHLLVSYLWPRSWWGGAVFRPSSHQVGVIRVVRYDVEDSTRGNTGATEIEVFQPS
jgi:hypothetical protein